jgi:hypothetical protein
MTVAQAIQAFRDITIVDMYPVQASTDAEILVYLNIGKREIFRALNYLAEKVSITIVPAQQTYSISALATPLFTVTEVWYNNQMLFSDQWSLENDTLTVLPTISAGTILQVTGYKRGITLTTSPVVAIVLPEDLHLPMVQMAIGQACGSQEDVPETLTRLQNLRAIANRNIINFQALARRARFPF